MTYFKLDIPKINESVNKYKKIKNDCLEDINIVYGGLSYTESGWNDPSAYTFIEKTKKDKYKINEYFDYLDNLYNEIKQFKIDIDSLCSKEGYRRNTVTLKFDDSEIENCKKYLNSAIAYLDDSLNQINISDFDVDFEYLNLIYILRNEIKNIKNKIKVLIQDINNFVNLVNDKIYDSKYRLKRISNFNFDLKTINYKWKTTDIDTSIIDKKNQEIYFNVKGAKIENKAQKSALFRTSPSYSSNINKIDSKEIEVVEGLNNNLYTSYATKDNIDLNKVEKVSGLNNNLYNFFAKEKDIELKDNQKIEGLNNNLYTNYATKDNIDLNKVEKVSGLNKDLNTTYANQNDINSNDVETIKDINKNINSASFKDIKINNIVQKIKGLNDNVVSVKTNSNTINYSINNNLKVTDNINNSKINQTSVDQNIVSSNYDLSSGINIAEANTTSITEDVNKNINLDINIKKIESLNELDKK